MTPWRCARMADGEGAALKRQTHRDRGTSAHDLEQIVDQLEHGDGRTGWHRVTVHNRDELISRAQMRGNEALAQQLRDGYSYRHELRR